MMFLQESGSWNTVYLEGIWGIILIGSSVWKTILTNIKKSIVLNSCKSLEMQFEYNVCGKLLNSKPCLQRHRRIHNGKNSFKYNKCGRAFRMLWKLNKHKKTHPERKVYQCAECGKAYRQKTNLVQHQKINAKEKPFKCEACGKPSPGCHLTVIIRKSTMKRKPMSAMYVASLSNKTQPSVNIKTFTKRSCTDVSTVWNLSFGSLSCETPENTHGRETLQVCTV